MLQSRFIGLALLLLGIFLVPAAANACEMHHQAAETAKHTNSRQNPDKKMDCCKHAAAKHQHKKGHCDDNNCTNNNCHPTSVFSMYIVHTIEVMPPLKTGKAYDIKPTDHQLTAYTYTIWQPPRLS